MSDNTLPRIALLATGGTIAGAQAQANGAGYRPGAWSVAQLLDAVPGMDALAHIQAEQVANIGSQNMSHAVWTTLATRVAELADSHGIDGIVITHGTDTLEETAYFLSLIAHTDKPVVLVGAMRPATALGAEGPANLYNAVALAASPETRGRGPVVVMNDDIHYAREVQKISSTGVCAFTSPNRGRAGIMHAGKPRFYSRNTTRHTTVSEFTLSALQAANWPRVDIVYAHAGMDGMLIDALVGRTRGIVLAGVGDGHATDEAMSALARASSAGIAVVRASRTGSGLVTPEGELHEAGSSWISAGDLSPQKARVLLMLVLSAGLDFAQWQRCFDEY